MVQPVKLKRSSTAGSAPASLLAGELAVNLIDRSLMVGDGTSVLTLMPGRHSSGQHYVESGANVQMVGDRLFVGGATLNNGTNVGSQPDWLTTLLLGLGRTFAFQQVTQFATLTGENGAAGNAILGAGRTSKFTYDGNAIGILGVGINDNTDPARFTGAYGGYFEGFALSGTHGPAYGIEVDTINLNASGITDPYQQSTIQTVGLQLASGAEFSGGFQASAAINIRNNGQTFEKGITFGYSAISGADGVNGTGIAIAFGKGHMMQWYGSAGVKTSSITCTGTTLDSCVRQEFLDGQVRFRNSADINIFQVLSTANAVNFLQVASSAANTPVQVSVAGSSTNIGIQFLPKGSEYLWFGTYTAGVVTQAGYITIKDTGGTVRRLLVG